MVLAIAYDIRVFLLIMIMALFGFSQGFWLISQRGEHLPFGKLIRCVCEVIVVCAISITNACGNRCFLSCINSVYVTI